MRNLALRLSTGLLGLAVAFAVSQPVLSQGTEAAPAAKSGQGAVVVALGKDSPSADKDAFVTVSLSIIEAAKVGKIVTDISYPDKGMIEFDRAELTPDMKSAGVDLKAEKKSPDGSTAGLQLTFTSKQPIVDGIVANIVFKVLKRPKSGQGPPEEMKVPLSHNASVWTVDNQQLSVVTSEPGEVDFEYAPVVFACFFYMH